MTTRTPGSAADEVMRANEPDLSKRTGLPGELSKTVGSVPSKTVKVWTVSVGGAAGAPPPRSRAGARHDGRRRHLRRAARARKERRDDEAREHGEDDAEAGDRADEDADAGPHVEVAEECRPRPAGRPSRLVLAGVVAEILACAGLARIFRVR